ncbi:MAG: hypothetical protein IPG45_03165 [Deltaproteobacteria bacterium]|jgi:hypothetical protein|nr:hypothetical protein [Deltaproteobacteria bacterium]
MRVWLGPLVIVVGTACATTSVSQETCIERADEAYRRCQNPYRLPNQEPTDAVRGDEAQGCRLAHQQALAECGEAGGPQPPMIDLRPDAGTSP